MFARTPRLLLRPGWAEDAPALALGLAEPMICRNLSAMPWPFTLTDAQDWLAAPRDPTLPSLLAFERTDGEPRLIGGASLGRRPSGAVELGYWVCREQWNRGLATEAASAVLEIARAIGITQVEASHYLDNPASARVLEKLGFTPTGVTAMRMSCARAAEAPVRLVRTRLSADAAKEEPMAA
ncbi:MAG TPA: GNAT family N-acetyltransferase [Sphingomicrobium sp.]